MALQLTPDQEQRINAIVQAGAFHSPEAALDAAVTAVENAVAFEFEGSPQELDALLADGLNSGPDIEVDDSFVQRFTAQTDEMVRNHQARKAKR